MRALKLSLEAAVRIPIGIARSVRSIVQMVSNSPRNLRTYDQKTPPLFFDLDANVKGCSRSERWGASVSPELRLFPETLGVLLQPRLCT